MKAIFYEGAEHVAFKEAEMPKLPDGWALIKTSHVGICGTDLNIFAGTHPRAAAPLIMGHEFSGTVLEGHPALEAGTKVTVNPLLSCGKCGPCLTGQPHVCESLKLIGIDCDGGMAEYVAAPIDSIIPLPDDMSLEAGALAEPVAVAVHAVRQGGYVPGDRVVVFGAGTIGLCVALVLRSLGATDIIVAETNEHRLAMAKELGFVSVNPLNEDVNSVVLEKTNGLGADFVFDCAGHPSVLTQLTELVKVRGNIIIVAAYKKPAAVNLLQGMFKELSIQFVRVYTPRDFEIAIDLLHSQSSFEKMITHVLPPEEAEKGFELLTTGTNAVKVMYTF
ncbi:zinc-dependent alcohol dehydrogenase [Cytobacillus gottheilii]|uniref:zinc-dependent alcohol dehydrogenase n=1 Tax=Cytobacillus gottheilii TaxID=859144 RepID=UPI0009BC3D73|nr:alcohol dehydrogenase catalytic domain-containing protein [Cytobacillus gottheilii]